MATKTRSETDRYVTAVLTSGSALGEDLADTRIVTISHSVPSKVRTNGRNTNTAHSYFGSRQELEDLKTEIARMEW